jgi:acyl-CoA reductase-like NAD-dependent aldehyde dehydrogenase
MLVQRYLAWAGGDLLARKRRPGPRGQRGRGCRRPARRVTVKLMGTSVWAQGPGQAWAPEQFDSVNPATSEVIATFPVHGPAEIGAAVDRARQAAAWWAHLGYAQRRTRLLAWKSYLARYLARLAQLVHEETGKPLADAQLEIVLAIVHIDWAAKNARKVLGTRRVHSGLIAINQVALLEYQPLGVVGVIGPWNYPVFTPMGSIVYALAAGNAVVFKPSEFTPAVGGWLVSSLREVVPEQPVLQLVTGAADTGQALALSGADKIAFTGSAGTAKKVMAACAENLTPLVAGCGGKDAFLVGADADLDAAADAAAWGTVSNAGQTCVGVERVYVVDEVYHQFLDKLAERVAAVRAGEDREADYGPMTIPGQTEIIERHVSDALARGGRPVVGGLASIQRPYVGPVVLADVPEESRAVAEETFGPTLTVTRVSDLEEGVRLANASRYALGSAVFTRNGRRALAAARALRSGMTSINSVIAFATVPALPFGGSGDSGFGRIHGEDGLREFSRAKSITRRRMRPLADLTTLKRTDKDLNRLLRLVSLIHGKRYR